MDLAILAAKVAPLSFDFDGETVKAEFYPHKITAEYRAQLQKTAQRHGEDEDAEDEEAAADVRDNDAQMLSDLLVSWNIEFDGTPFPPTYENLYRTPTVLLGRLSAEIWVALGKLATPGKAKK